MKNNNIVILINVIVLLFFSKYDHAQNLVLNGSFENITSCPTGEGQVNRASPWVSARGTCDLYNICNSGVFDVPRNTIGYQNPRTGNGYAGFFVGQGIGEVREYLHTPLTSPLVAGETYCVKFYISIADELDSFNEPLIDFSVNNIGLYFSTTAFTPDQWDLSHIPVNPQIVNNPADQLLTDTLNWMLIEGQYMALGGEQYITIGSFNDNAGQDTTALDFWQDDLVSYYYIDDISVKNCNCPPITIGTALAELNCHDDSNAEISALATGGTAPYSYFLSLNLDSLENQTNLLDSVHFSNLSVGNYTISILDSNLCESQQNVTIINPEEISLNAILVSDSCDLGIGEINISVVGGIVLTNYSYSWNNNFSNSEDLSNLQSGLYHIQITDDKNCSVDSTFILDGTHKPNAGVHFSPSLPAYNGIPILFTDISKSNADSLISYMWNFSNGSFSGVSEIENTFFIQDSNYLEYIIVNSDGCSDTLAFPIEVFSDLTIPNVLTSNVDNINETFLIKGIEAFPSVSLLIFNRWGNIIYEDKKYKNDWKPSEDLNEGTYYYKIITTDNSRKESTYHGFFQILK